MRVLAFDPGGTTAGTNKAAANGWCYMENRPDFRPKALATGALYSTDDLHAFLKAWDTKKLPLDIVVYESYTPLPNKKGAKANLGRRMITSEAIGSITMWASFNNLPVEFYDAKLKATQAAHSGIDPKGKAKRYTHGMDAFNHGWWYLYKHNLIKSVLELEMGI